MTRKQKRQSDGLIDAVGGRPVKVSEVLVGADVIVVKEKHAEAASARFLLQHLNRLWNEEVRHVVLELPASPELAALRQRGDICLRALAIGSLRFSPVLDVALAATAVGMQVYGGDVRDIEGMAKMIREARAADFQPDADDWLQVQRTNASMAQTEREAHQRTGGRGIVLVGATHVTPGPGVPIDEHLRRAGRSTTVLGLAGGIDGGVDEPNVHRLVTAAQRTGRRKPFLWQLPEAAETLLCVPEYPVSEDELQAVLAGTDSAEAGRRLLAPHAASGHPRGCEMVARYSLTEGKFVSAARWHEEGAKQGDDAQWMDAARMWAVAEQWNEADRCLQRAVDRAVPGADLIRRGYDRAREPMPQLPSGGRGDRGAKAGIVVGAETSETGLLKRVRGYLSRRGPAAPTP